MSPIQFVVDIEAEVADDLAWGNGDVRRDGIILEEDARWGCGAIMGSSEEDKFSFGAFQGKTRPCKPIVCRSKAVLQCLLDMCPRRSRGENEAVIHVQAERGIRP